MLPLQTLRRTVSLSLWKSRYQLAKKSEVNLHPISEQVALSLKKFRPEWLAHHNPNDSELNLTIPPLESSGTKETLSVKVTYHVNSLSLIERTPEPYAHSRTKRMEFECLNSAHRRCVLLTEGNSPPWQQNYLGNIEGLVEQMLKEIERVTSSPPAPKPVAPKAPPPPPEPVDVSKLDIRVAKILSVAAAPNSEKLYVCQVDVGEEVPRQFCSGLRPFLPPERLLNRSVVAVCNLKPARLAGNDSAGMFLAATEGSQVDLINPPPGTTPGQPVTCPDYRGQPAEPSVLHKKKMLPAIIPDLQAREGVAYYRNSPLQVLGVSCTSTLSGAIS